MRAACKTFNQYFEGYRIGRIQAGEIWKDAQLV